MEYEHANLPAADLYNRTPDLAISLHTDSLAAVFNAKSSDFVRKDLGLWHGFTIILGKSLKVTFANARHDTEDYGAMMWIDVPHGKEQNARRSLVALSRHVNAAIAFCDTGHHIS